MQDSRGVKVDGADLGPGQINKVLQRTQTLYQFRTVLTA